MSAASSKFVQSSTCRGEGMPEALQRRPHLGRISAASRPHLGRISAASRLWTRLHPEHALAEGHRLAAQRLVLLPELEVEGGQVRA